MLRFIEHCSGSSQAAFMLLKQQQQQQCGPASFSEMENLVAALSDSIVAASISSSSGSCGNIVDVHAMTQACAIVHHVTIIGRFNAVRYSL
jgi:hypothetical protein